MRNVKCDSEGVPFLIQKIVWLPETEDWKVLFFNGMTKTFYSYWVYPTDNPIRPSKRDFEDAVKVIEAKAKMEWEEWFPLSVIHGRV